MQEGQWQLPTKPALGLVAVVTQHRVIPLERVMGYYELLSSESKPEDFCSKGQKELPSKRGLTISPCPFSQD